MMDDSLIQMALVPALFVTAVVALASWYVAARLGQVWAIGLPLVALSGFLVTVWTRSAASPDGGLWLVALGGIIAAPVLIGAGIGIAIYRWRRKVARA